MAEPFVGEIRMFGGNFAPFGWAFCNGQLLSISQNDVLFNLIGTTYGGDGVNTFALPNLQGRLPLHTGVGPNGSGFVQGELLGEENHTLTINEIPNHAHQVMGMGHGTTNTVSGNLYAGGGLAAYKSSPGAAMHDTVVRPNNGGQPHDNTMPFLVVSFIISLFGIYPSRN